MEKPKDQDDEAIEPVVNDNPDLMTLIDWVFFAGAPIGELEEPTEEVKEDESASRDDDQK